MQCWISNYTRPTCSIGLIFCKTWQKIMLGLPTLAVINHCSLKYEFWLKCLNVHKQTTLSSAWWSVLKWKWDWERGVPGRSLLMTSLLYRYGKYLSSCLTDTDFVCWSDRYSIYPSVLSQSESSIGTDDRIKRHIICFWCTSV